MTRYLVVWVFLVVLTVLTFGLSFVPLGGAAMLVALLLALAKAIAVGWIFMHLHEHGGAARIVAMVAVVFVAILVSLVGVDVFTRAPVDGVAVPGVVAPASHVSP